MHPEALIVFEMSLPGRGIIRGPHGSGGSTRSAPITSPGAEIIKLPLRQARRLRLALDPDAEAMARTWQNTLLGVLCGAFVLVVEDIVLRQYHVRNALAAIWPSAVALLVMGACAVVFFRTWE